MVSPVATLTVEERLAEIERRLALLAPEMQRVCVSSYCQTGLTISWEAVYGLADAGVQLSQVKRMTDCELLDIDGVGKVTLDRLRAFGPVD